MLFSCASFQQAHAHEAPGDWRSSDIKNAMGLTVDLHVYDGYGDNDKNGTDTQCLQLNKPAVLCDFTFVLTVANKVRGVL